MRQTVSSAGGAGILFCALLGAEIRPSDGEDENPRRLKSLLNTYEYGCLVAVGKRRGEAYSMGEG